MSVSPAGHLQKGGRAEGRQVSKQQMKRSPFCSSAGLQSFSILSRGHPAPYWIRDSSFMMTSIRPSLATAVGGSMSGGWASGSTHDWRLFLWFRVSLSHIGLPQGLYSARSRFSFSGNVFSCLQIPTCGMLCMLFIFICSSKLSNGSGLFHTMR